MLLNSHCIDSSKFTMNLCRWVALRHSLWKCVLIGYILGIYAGKSRSYILCIERSIHRYLINMNWIIRARSERFSWHVDDVCDSFVYGWVCSLLHTVNPSLVWVLAPLAPLISIFDRLASFRPTVWCPKQLLCRVHWKLESLWEVAF